MGFILFCTLAFFVQAITCQTLGNPLNPGPNFNGLPYGPNYANGLAGPGFAGPGMNGPGFAGPGFAGPGFAGPGFVGPGMAGPGLSGPGLVGATAGAGGSFTVTSTSPISPTGISVLAENLAIEGPLAVGGQLPFLGSVGIEGMLPAAGVGAVSYGCGSGNVGITNEVGSPMPAQYGPGYAGPGLAGPGYAGPGLASPGFGGPSLAGPGYAGPGLAGPGYAGPGMGYGAGLSGPVGASMPGANFGPGVASTFGTGLANPAFGPGAGLGYNGVGNLAGAVLK